MGLLYVRNAQPAAKGPRRTRKWRGWLENSRHCFEADCWAAWRYNVQPQWSNEKHIDCRGWPGLGRSADVLWLYREAWPAFKNGSCGHIVLLWLWTVSVSSLSSCNRRLRWGFAEDHCLYCFSLKAEFFTACTLQLAPVGLIIEEFLCLIRI